MWLSALLTVFFISPQGDNQQVGSQEAPWRTLAYGVLHARIGDTLQLTAGTFEEPFATRTDKPLTIRGAGADSTVLTWPNSQLPGEAFSNQHHGLRFEGSPLHDVEGICIEGIAFRGHRNAEGQKTTHGAIFVRKARHIKITDCHFEGFSFNAIWVTDAEHVEIGRIRGLNTSMGSYNYCMGQISFGRSRHVHLYDLHLRETERREGGYGITQIGFAPRNQANWIQHVLIENSVFDMQPDNVWNHTGPNFAIELAGIHADVEIRNIQSNIACSFPGKFENLDLPEVQHPGRTMWFHHNTLRCALGYGVEVGTFNSLYEHNVIELLNPNEKHINVIGDQYAFVSFKKPDEKSVRRNIVYRHNVAIGINSSLVRLAGGYDEIDIVHNTVIYNNKDWQTCNPINSEANAYRGKVRVKNNVFAVRNRPGTPDNSQPFAYEDGGAYEADHNYYQGIRQLPVAEGPHSRLVNGELGFRMRGQDEWTMYQPAPQSVLRGAADRSVANQPDIGAVVTSR